MKVGKAVIHDSGESQDPVQTFLYVLNSGVHKCLRMRFSCMSRVHPSFWHGHCRPSPGITQEHHHTDSVVFACPAFISPIGDSPEPLGAG